MIRCHGEPVEPWEDFLLHPSRASAKVIKALQTLILIHPRYTPEKIGRVAFPLLSVTQTESAKSQLINIFVFAH